MKLAGRLVTVQQNLGVSNTLDDLQTRRDQWHSTPPHAIIVVRSVKIFVYTVV